MISYQTARSRILSAHRRFHVRALTAMHPGVKGQERARALAREQRLGHAYTQNMSHRLSEGLRRIQFDPSLTDPERDVRARVLLATEQRYLRQHLTEAARRVAREAEVHRLIEAGESSGFWLMDPSVHRHTPDCVAMGNRLWSMDVLRRVNPATRHAGCRCRIISEADARRMGHAIVRGYMTAGVQSALLREGQADAPVWWPGRQRIRELMHECTIRVPWFPGAEDQFPRLREAAARRGARKAWDESKHRRNPKGSKGGGRFTRRLAPVERAATGETGVPVAVTVPVRPGMDTHVGDPHQAADAERSTTVRGVLDPSLDARMNEYLDAVKDGDADEMMRLYDRLRTEARALATNTDPPIKQKARDESVRTIDHVHATAINPSGETVPVGTKINIGGKTVKMPLSPREPTIPKRDYIDKKTGKPVKGIKWKPGLRAAWATGGSFQWHVPRGALGDERRTKRILDALVESGSFKVIRDKQGNVRLECRVQGRRTLQAEQLAHWHAVTAESAFPQLRRLRIKDKTTALADDRPLELRPDMAPNVESLDDARYIGLNKQALGDAAQAALPEFAGKLAELGFQNPDDFREWTFDVGNRNGALDWRSDHLGIEVKGEAWVGRAPGLSEQAGVKVSPATVDKKYQETKLDQCRKWGEEHGTKPLNPTTVVPICDLHDGVAHLFMIRFPGDWNGNGEWVAGTDDSGRTIQAFSGQRIPGDMWEKLQRGELEPGSTDGKKGLWTYVGTVQLRYNPHVLPSERLKMLGIEPGGRVMPGQAAAITMAGEKSATGAKVGGRGSFARPQSAITGGELPRADVKVSGRPLAPPPAKAGGKVTAATRKAADEAYINRREAVKLAKEHRGWTHQEIADAMNRREDFADIKPGTVGKYLKLHADEHPDEDYRRYQGARGDLRRRPGVAVERVGSGRRVGKGDDAGEGRGRRARRQQL